MAFNEQEEAKVREIMAAFDNGKRINELERAKGLPKSMLIEVMDASGETRSMELERAVAEAGNPIAGRWWANDLATPTAGGWFGSLDFLRQLPKTLGLGRYLVTDDRKMRKLDPENSTKFTDGSTAALDGSMGQCMWCWNRAWYFTEIVTAGRTYWAITLKPLDGHKSVKIPVGGTSWLGAAVMDKEEMKMCSVISEDERFRGGGGSLPNLEGNSKKPGPNTRQRTMLGMAACGIPLDGFREYAHRRGEGWEANWFMTQAAVQILIAVIMGTRDSQAPYIPELDADGLYQGGFGEGVTDIDSWLNYNSYLPLIPTDVGLAMGDNTGLEEYALPPSETATNQEKPYRKYKVPVFFGLVHAGFGHLWRLTSGLAYNMQSGELYIAKSMYPNIPTTELDCMTKVMVDVLKYTGYIRRISTNGLCMTPTEVDGSEDVFYSDSYSVDSDHELCIRAAGGCAYDRGGAGIFSTYLVSYKGTNNSFTSPLCFFAEDPKIE